MDQVTRLNQVILDSLPHWAMLIDARTRTILAANKLAMEGGAGIDRQCWDDFGHRLFIDEEHRKLIESNSERKRDNQIKCNFCLADEAVEAGEPRRKEVEIEGVIWDTWWVPVEENLYLHYAMDITDIRKSEEARIKNVELESMMKTAAAVCHTINQPLQVLFSCLEMLGLDHEMKYLDKAKESALKIANTTRKMQGMFKYETKEHIDGTEILDIDASSSKK